jgi:hypothetical protein
LGGAYWNFRRRHPFYGNRVWLTGYATYPCARLHLDDAGGTLSRPGRSQPEIMFSWPEVEKFERGRVLALPLLGEGVCITLKEEMFWGVPRRLLFFSGTRARSSDILEFAESKGVAVKRRARNMFVVP